MPSFPVIRSEQYPATDETQCVTVILPAGDEYKYLLAGLMGLASNPYNYDEPDSVQVEGISAIWDDAYSQIDWSGCVFPALVGLQDRVLLPAYFAIKISGNAIIYNKAVNNGGIAFQNTSASTDNFGWFGLKLRAGSYTAKWLVTTNTSSANVDVFLRPDPSGTNISIWSNLQLYTGSVLENVLQQASFTLPLDGLYDLIVAVDGHHASSLAYLVQHTMMELIRTGD